MTKKDQIINQIIEVANKTHPDSEIILYGSQARGDSTMNSDWDLLILLNKSGISFEQETKIMDDYYELELDSGIVISPIIYTKHDWNTKFSMIPLRDKIETEGIIIK